jgi:hypothetical protein
MQGIWPSEEDVLLLLDKFGGGPLKGVAVLTVTVKGAPADVADVMEVDAPMQR